MRQIKQGNSQKPNIEDSQDSGIRVDFVKIAGCTGIGASSKNVFKTIGVRGNLKVPKYLPTPMESARHLSNYLSLIKTLLREIELL